MDIVTRYVLAFAPDIIGTIVSVLLGVLGIAVKNLVQRYINTDTKRKVAKTVVEAVEQICIDLHGEEKFNAAMGFLREQLETYNIYINEREMQLLIEAAVNEFNRQRQ